MSVPDQTAANVAFTLTMRQYFASCMLPRVLNKVMPPFGGNTNFANRALDLADALLAHRQTLGITDKDILPIDAYAASMFYGILDTMQGYDDPALLAADCASECYLMAQQMVDAELEPSQPVTQF